MTREKKGKEEVEMLRIRKGSCAKSGNGKNEKKKVLHYRD